MTFHSPKETDLGLPLAALDAVVIDSETTGLNPKVDRVIELAGVAIHAGTIIEDSTIDILIKPDIPIPERSTRIHRITDKDVHDCPSFEEGFASFSSWVDSRFVLGYSIGFDLSVFESEHKRNGLVWHEPRSLDVEELIRVLSPNLPNFSLDTVASWLNVSTANRHRALPDAIMTAQVFIKLIPLLRDQGILTFAEARRATGEINRRQGGFERLEIPAHSAIQNVDAYPYKKRIADIMTAPVMVDAHTSIQDTLGILISKKIGSVIVRLEGDRHYGILTETDILRAIHTGGIVALGETAAHHCSDPVALIHHKEFMYRAMVTMGEKNLRRLAVFNDEDEIVGVISSRDMFGNYSSEAIGLGKDILEANTPEELGKVWSGLASVCRSLVHSGISPTLVAAIISRELRGLTKRACEMAEDELLSDSVHSSIPNYAMIVLGSGGRGESLLAMDQDNAIIYEHSEPTDEADRLFEAIGKRVADILNQTGILYCTGGVMASNPEWRKSVAAWQETIHYWLNRTSSKDLLNSDIYFDSLPTHGDYNLANNLRNEALELASQAKPFLNRLSLRASRFDVPTGLFGRLKLENGRVDLKKGGVMPIFSTARVVALRHGIRPRSTAARLEEFKKRNAVPDQLIDDLLSAHGILLGLILRQQMSDLEKGLKPSNSVAPSELSGIHQQELRWALDKLYTIPNILGTPI